MRSTEHIRPELVSFDDIDYNDPKQLRAAQQSMIREQWIRVEALKVLRGALEKCFQTQGSNQYENCKDLAERYLDMLPNHKVQGYLAYQRNDPTK
uniref:ARAD1A15818p n=1 Tax=Blastobotrys adeninivorans TaxID=409370 RepID=A0A060T4C2_BLAAD